MTLSIDKFKQPDGSYVCEDGCYHEDATDYYQVKEFGFCGCYMPTENLKLIRDGLNHLKTRSEYEYEEQIKRAVEIFGNESSYAFFLYWVDKEELTEHGGSVWGSWLSEKGEQTLQDLEEILN